MCIRVRTTVPSSLMIGTVLPPEKAMAGLSLMRTGRVSNASCLWRNAIRVRHENRL